MVGRLSELIVSPGRTEELCNTIRDKVVPLVRTSPGFIDEYTLVLQNESRVVVVLTFWRSSGDVDRYVRELFPATRKLVMPFLDAEPKAQTFELRVQAAAVAGT